MTHEEFRQLRIDHNLTQRALGALLGYSPNYIARVERGDEPLTERFARLVRALLRGRKKRRVP